MRKANRTQEASNMTTKILLIALCGVLAVSGVGAALADDGDDAVGSLEPIEVRKYDSQGDVELVDDDPDDDPTGDRDKTRGDDGTDWGHNHDHDSTANDDGTRGGDNSSAAAVAVAPAPAPEPAPAPPVYDDYSDDGGYAVSAS
jgi:hypothetical protein